MFKLKLNKLLLI